MCREYFDLNRGYIHTPSNMKATPRSSSQARVLCVNDSTRAAYANSGLSFLCSHINTTKEKDKQSAPIIEIHEIKSGLVITRKLAYGGTSFLCPLQIQMSTFASEPVLILRFNKSFSYIVRGYSVDRSTFKQKYPGDN